jgi:hypothetical protein
MARAPNESSSIIIEKNPPNIDLKLVFAYGY